MNSKTIVITLAVVIGLAALLTFSGQTAVKPKKAEVQLNPYEAVGLNMDDRNELRLVIREVDRGTKTETNNGYIFRHARFGEGVEVWAFFNGENYSIIPFYRGTTTNKVKINSSKILADGSGAVSIQSCEADGNVRGFEFQVSVPDLYLHKDAVIPQIADFNLSVSVGRITLYDDIAKFNLEAGREPDSELSPSFRGSGHVADNFKITVADFTGEVLDSRLITNPVTGNKFYWLLVDVYLFKLDVVVRADALDKAPVKGNWVTVMGEITGDWASDLH